MAAGAIAEKYLREAYGMEIVAFVGSVGRVALPFTEGEEEVLGTEYMELLRGVMREDVDKEITRCPHKQTSAKMEEVRGRTHFSSLNLPQSIGIRTEGASFAGHSSSQSAKRLPRRHHHLCGPKLSPRAGRASLRQARGRPCSRHAVHSFDESV